MVRQSTARHLFVILGGTGDLAYRKILPALFQLDHRGLLDPGARILAVSRKPLSDDEYRKIVIERLNAKEPDLIGDIKTWCNRTLFYHPLRGDPKSYQDLAHRIESIEREHGLPGHRVLYLALPPSVFPAAITGLGQAGLSHSHGWTRIVIEKPFGRDLSSARDLNRTLHSNFDEAQVYRIDHFLGKETVQNLFVFRFANNLFESVWNRDRVQCVQITVAEDLGVENRAGYYDQAGAVRDMIQNHLFQLLALTAMDAPFAFESSSIRYEKIKVFRSIEPIRPENVVFGQYTRVRASNGFMPGYLEEENIPHDSKTETYAALKLFVNSWRWQGVPFYLRTGKRLPRKLTQIVVVFRKPPICLFESMGSCTVQSNTLAITLQPDEGFSLTFGIKAPGEPFTLRELPLDFMYKEAFRAIPDAYETLLLDILEGDQSLFVHAEETEAAWRLVDPLLDGSTAVHPYPAGSWGPDEAHRLLVQSGDAWQIYLPERRRIVVES